MVAMTETIHTLRDGSRALIRPIRPDDKGRLVAGFRALSPQSRYLRFHAPIEALSDALVRYLTEIDYEDHMAWVAIAVDEPEQPGMGVARYIRLPDEPTVAEVAVTVVDDYQGRGLGTLLLGILTRSAQEHGIKVFRNYVLAENRAMLGLLDQLGATRAREAPGLYRVDLELPEDVKDLPDTPAGRVFREAARGNVPPFCPFHPMSWLRRLAASAADEGVSVVGPAGREAPMLRAHLDAVYAEDDGEGHAEPQTAPDPEQDAEAPAAPDPARAAEAPTALEPPDDGGGSAGEADGGPPA